MTKVSLAITSQGQFLLGISIKGLKQDFWLAEDKQKKTRSGEIVGYPLFLRTAQTLKH